MACEHAYTLDDTGTYVYSDPGIFRNNQIASLRNLWFIQNLNIAVLQCRDQTVEPSLK
jgi:hypothetical protein